MSADSLSLLLLLLVGTRCSAAALRSLGKLLFLMALELEIFPRVAIVLVLLEGFVADRKVLVVNVADDQSRLDRRRSDDLVVRVSLVIEIGKNATRWQERGSFVRCW